MAQFASAIAACNSESKFAQAYSKGVKKTEYWEVGSLFSLYWLIIYIEMSVKSLRCFHHTALIMQLCTMSVMFVHVSVSDTDGLC